MAERWRTWYAPLDIEESEEVLELSDGRRQRIEKIAWPPEVIERMRAGYQCVKCLECFEQAWPIKCPVCGVSVRRDQAAYFAREYDPKLVRIGPSTTLADEIERLPEEVAKEAERSGRQR